MDISCTIQSFQRADIQSGWRAPLYNICLAPVVFFFLCLFLPMSILYSHSPIQLPFSFCIWCQHDLLLTAFWFFSYKT
uniref:Uncharacterized protein n=1 Tax=Rhizophora mucronata TaxID=61149 RepID=A0A2P2QVL3_RHIMU